MESNVYSIEQMFSSALAFLDKISERGFQAELARKLDMRPGYISGAVTGTRGFSEENRRAIVAEACSIKGLSLSYEAFLTLGQLILDGVPGEEALELAKAGDKPFPAILSTLDDPLFVMRCRVFPQQGKRHLSRARYRPRSLPPFFYRAQRYPEHGRHFFICEAQLALSLLEFA